MEQTQIPPANAQDATAREQIMSCLKNLSKDEYNDLLNEMMTEDF